MINNSKTEEFSIERGGDDAYRSCKFLGSIPDTEADIKRRKSLCMMAYAKCKPIFFNKKLSRKTKFRVFDTYVSSVFLYNSELWTLTKKLANDIDVIQRRLIRYILKIFYPNIVTNDVLYSRSKLKPWSEQIKKRRLKWTGHLLRLDDDTPAKRALKSYIQPAIKPRGRSKFTWITTVQKELDEIDSGINFNDQSTYHIANDRKNWRRITKTAITSVVSIIRRYNTSTTTI